MRFTCMPAKRGSGKLAAWAAVPLVLFGLVIAPPVNSHQALAQAAQLTSVGPITGFSAWRPYSNPNRLVSIGMNKGEVLAIAGKPDHEESYYQSRPGRLIRISDWYYIRSGHDPETTLLKFAQESLVSITTTPTRR
jgi:hypothetical protein